MRMRVIVIELLIPICWFPRVFATNARVSTNVQIEKEKEREEIQTESRWEERAIEVLEQMAMIGLIHTTLPTVVVECSSAQNRPVKDLGWNAAAQLYKQEQTANQKVQQLSRHINETRLCAQNILTHIKERNDTASKILWETSAKSASEARQLAEEAASFTKDVVENLSEERKKKAVATIASQIKAQIRTINWRTSQFNNSQKAILMKASNYQTIQLSNLKSKLRSFRREAKSKVDAVRRAAEVDVKKTIKYLRLAQSYSSSSQEIQSLYAPLDEVAAFAKDDAIIFAQKASQESLNYVQKVLDSFKERNFQTMKRIEETIEGALKKTKTAQKETIESWTKTNHAAMDISQTFFKFTDVQSVLEKAKSAIDRARADIEKAKHSSKWEAIEEDLGKMSDTVENVVKIGHDLGTFQLYQSVDMGQSMYGIWAQRTWTRVLRLKDYFSRINQTNPVLAEKDLEAAVKKWVDAVKNGQHIAQISHAAVEDATGEMRKSVELVQVVFHATETKAKAINEKYREQCFVELREAEAIWTETNLAVAVALDEITETVTENYRITQILVREAEDNRKLTYGVPFEAGTRKSAGQRPRRGGDGDTYLSRIYFLPLGIVLVGIFVVILDCVSSSTAATWSPAISVERS